ncbi:transcriptional regulator [Seonamhaeicola sp. S2-3]|uniref:transcriptional regulator n=1 Tax=Seonamhaeicola sp. S2-3 TaxID=1936081 RepID=UPI00097268F3|nr:transcriptional regulator [Seonamhaeicola sp. S2-3]APY11763.1 transcriptional regulator [Seonamhaeicola sp. S2-3]
MTSVITGDIIKSREEHPEKWMTTLKNTLSILSPDSSNWEIYRGDSFQIEIEDIAQSFLAAVYIKACIKMIKGLDVRLAIGIGNKTYQGKDVTESNGEAFIFSGETLETLKKEKQNLRIKTSNKKLNQELNLYFKLALVNMDNWTVNSAEVVKLSIENPSALQQELAEKIGTKQDAISKRQKRAGLENILELNTMFQQKISTL